MPVFADLLPEPSIWYPVELYGSTSSIVSNFFYSIFRVWLILWLIIWLLLFIFWIICLRKIFKKAWLPWRWSLIPVYREYLRFKMVWRNGRRTASLLCPVMFAIILIFSFFKTSEKFGKDKEQFWFWLWFLNPIFLWILAFDDSKYKK